MEARGAARVVEEKDLAGELLAREIRALLEDQAFLARAGAAARAMSRPDAAARVADLLEGPSV
jgi:UDP-N-acetylglucosamine--N-acetylmuramyl-(pentapeptide) pyrophosphoryl-undecaprenol N-acetylglucosamine transferase